MWAADINQNPEVILTLLKAGAVPNAQDICERCGYVFWFALRLKNKFAVRKDDKPVEGEPFPGSEIDKII